MTIDLEFLGKQMESILIELRSMRDEMNNIKVRMTALESAFGLLITQVAALNDRIDQIDRWGRNRQDEAQ
jgi:hypothetical protein